MRHLLIHDRIIDGGYPLDSDLHNMADDGCPLVQRQAIDHAQRAHLPLIIRSFESKETRVA